MKIGIIGTNFISDRLCEAARLVSGVQVAAVYSRAQETGDAFAARHGIEKVYTGYGELLMDRDIDAVYVASPTICHAPQAIKAMHAGKHVLCEKMMAATLPEMRLMRQVARKQGVVLLEAMRPAHDPAYDMIAESLPRLGKIRRATLEFCQYSSRYDRFKAGELTNAFDPRLKNSALADIGIYPLHVAVRLFGMPKSVHGASVFMENGFEGAGTVTLGYEDKTVNIVYSKISDSVNPSVIEGECGSLLINKISAPAELTLRLRGQEAERLPTVAPENNMIYELAAFRDMVAGERDAEEYLQLTEMAQIVVDEVYRTAGISDRF